MPVLLLKSYTITAEEKQGRSWLLGAIVVLEMKAKTNWLMEGSFKDSHFWEPGFTDYP